MLISSKQVRSVFIHNVWQTLIAPKGWAWRTWALSIAVAWIFAAGPSLTHTFLYADWNVYEWKFAHPFEDIGKLDSSAAATGDASKLNFRLVVPIFAHLFGFSRYGAIILNACVGILSLYLVPQIFLRATGDRATSVLLSILFAGNYPTCLFFRPVTAAFDAVAFFLLIAACRFRNGAVILVLVLLAAFDDERAIIGSMLVPFYHFYARENEVGRKGSFADFLRSTPFLGVLSAILAYVPLRLYISHAFALKTYIGVMSPSLFLESWHLFVRWLVSIPFSLKGGYVLVIWAGIVGFRQNRSRLVNASFLLVFFLIVLASGSVYDVTRSAAYCFVGIFAAAAVLGPLARSRRHFHFLICLSLLTIVWPNFELFTSKTTDWSIWIKPMPVEVYGDWRFYYLNRNSLSRFQKLFRTKADLPPR